MASAKGFHADAQRYSAFRPDYSDGVLTYLVSALIRQPPLGGLVIEVGSGTGIFTRQLSQRLPAALPITAVEPSDVMRSAAIATAGAASSVTYRAGSAEHLPVEAGSARAVVAAAAAHWFDRPLFYPEARRVLCPSGLLAIVEYVRDEASSPAAQDLSRFTADHGGPQSYARPDYVAELRGLDGFTDFDVYQEAIVLQLTAEQYVGLALSSSHARPAIEKLGERRAEELLREIADRHRSTAGLIPFGYVFQAFTGRRA